MEQPPDSLATELEAMAAVGQALGELTDSAARRRVLAWATERFTAEAASAATPLDLESDPVPDPIADPALAIDSLDEMFVVHTERLDDDLGEFAGPAPRPVVVFDDAPRAPLATVIRSFAADFQRFAEEWNAATL